MWNNKNLTLKSRMKVVDQSWNFQKLLLAPEGCSDEQALTSSWVWHETSWDPRQESWYSGISF